MTHDNPKKKLTELLGNKQLIKLDLEQINRHGVLSN